MRWTIRGMSQQGGSPTGHEDDWWGQLYDDSTEDTGPAPAPDTLDDRFASVAGAVGADAGTEAVDEGFAQRRAPWDPPPPPGGRTSTQTPVTTVPESRMPREAVGPGGGADADPARDGPAAAVTP